MEEGLTKVADAKLFYRPIEVAIRWCGLIHLERKILSDTEPYLTQSSRTPIYPCIQQRIEILLDAILHNDLPYGCLGISVSSGEYIEPDFLTIRHTDLKQWFLKFRPSEKPAFLFDELERQIIASSETQTLYTALLAEIEILKMQIERNQTLLRKLEKERDFIVQENIKMASTLRHQRKPNARNERAYLQLIGSLVNLFLATTPSGKHYSLFTSQASIISALMAHNRNKAGFSQRTLEEKFAAARRSIDSSE
ncbi:hypothetical protein [Pseudomonas kitaguniensis]|uniref:hypothetical protein n=1 Tax=Pseudomonas kitaguniensis TaxID=2607908 RepID=UPI003D051928